jgi:hypothetical protein
MNKNIILARYNEDISWVLNNTDLFDKIYIINKGNFLNINFPNIIVYNLLNVGRESNTYLNFITTFYELIQACEDEIFIFSQAYPFDVNPYFLEDIKKLNESTAYPLSLSKASNIENMFAHLGIINETHPAGIPFINYYNHLFFDDFLNLKNGEKHHVKYSGIWAVKGKNILFRKKEFYEKCLSMVNDSVNPFEGYIFERMWQYIFDLKTLDWISHYDLIRKKYNKGTYKGIEVK